MAKLKLAIFASGRGSNAQVIMKKALEYKDELEVVLVVSDRPEAQVLRLAEEFEIPTKLFEQSKGRLNESEMQSFLKSLEVDWVLLAGFMRVLGPEFLEARPKYKGQFAKVVNIHPSKLPEFRGLNAYERAFKAKVKTSGVTLHFVDKGVDTGHIILSKTFARQEEDRFEDFNARGLKEEHKVYANFVEALALRKNLLTLKA